MKNIIITVVALVILVACGNDKKNTMVVKGEIKNLKKGTLYLEKVKDTILVVVDSINLNGHNAYTLSDVIESPEIYYLSLGKSPSKQLSFFGEPGTITINTKLDKFVFGATIKGLTNQQLLHEYNKIKDQFSGKRLDLMKADFEAKRDSDSLRIDSVENEINKLIKSKYRFTANFIITHPDNEVSPYLALTEFYDANLFWLDSVHKALTPKVKSSKYGKELEKYINKVKANE